MHDGINGQPSAGHDEKLTFLRKVFGVVQQTRDIENVAVQCPKCKNSSKKKLAIHIVTDKYHCWVCGIGGRLVSLLAQYRPTMVHEYVTRFIGRNVTFLDLGVEPARDVIIPDGFRMLATNLMSQDHEIRWAINYIKRRGLGIRDLWYFKFGISTDERMRRRVIMPSFDAQGKLNFYTGRAIDDKAYRKYMNCDAEKKSVVFNEINISWSNELTLVEGPFDLTKCDDNATCLLGSSLNEDSRLFYQIYKNRTPIVLALDSDMQSKSWQRIARLLAQYDIDVRILELGGFKDVGEMTHTQFKEAKSLAKPWDRDSALSMKIGSIRI